jgi:O-antigen/teichoic acid export membrane protein
MSLSAAVKRLGPWAVIEYLVSPLIGLMTTPLIIYSLGLSVFGSWVVLVSSGAFSVTLASGVSVALGRYIAENSTNALSLVRRAQLDAFQIMTVGSLFSAGLAIALIKVGGLSGENKANLEFGLLTIFAIIVVIDCYDTMFVGIIRGRLKYSLSARIEFISRTLQFLLMLLAMYIAPSFEGLLIATCVGSLARIAIRCHQCDLSWLSIKIFFNHRLRLDSPLLKTVGWTTVQNLGGALYASIDRIIVSAVFGPTALALYATASQLTNQIQAILGAAFSVLVNAVAAQSAPTTYQAMVSKCLRLSIVVALGGVGVYGVFYEASEAIFAAWLGSYASPQLLLLVPAVAFAAVLQTISVPAHFFLIGVGRFKLVAVMGLVAGVFSLIFLWMASQKLELQYALVARATYGAILLYYFVVLFRGRRKAR